MTKGKSLVIFEIRLLWGAPAESASYCRTQSAERKYKCRACLFHVLQLVSKIFYLEDRAQA